MIGDSRRVAFGSYRNGPLNVYQKLGDTDPPDRAAWNQQNHRMRVFAQLVHDTDRNAGNILITKTWNLY